jgi:hypothetical protein
MRRLWLATAVAVLFARASFAAPATCQPPHYRVVKTPWGIDSREGVSVAIVIALRDFAPDRLLCLVEALERKYARPEFVNVEIFSSAAEARSCIPDLVWSEGYSVCPHRHANYEFNARTKDRFVQLLPTGSANIGAETMASLPASTLRPCTLEINRRCVLELDLPDFPHKTLAALISGRVVVTGVVAGKPSLLKYAVSWEPPVVVKGHGIDR